MAHVAFESRGDDRVRAPVEVRGEDLAVAGTCVAGGKGVELPPGRYHAFATYPDGSTVHTAFAIADDAEQAHVRLQGPPRAAQPRAPAPPAPIARMPIARMPIAREPTGEPQIVRGPILPPPAAPARGGDQFRDSPERSRRRPLARLLGRLKPSLPGLPGRRSRPVPPPAQDAPPDAPPPPAPPQPVAVWAEVWTGNPLARLDGPERLAIGAAGRLWGRSEPAVARVELAQGPVNVIVPARTALRVPAPGEHALPQPAFDDPDLAAAVGFYARGLMREVATVAHLSPRSARGGGDAEGTAWAYLLLATGDTEEADRIVGRVQKPATPDESVLHAGLLARQGSHAMALHALCDAGRQGVPAFAAGVLLAVERLRLYSAADDLDDRGEAARVLGLLQPYATALVPGAVLTTYGGHPAEPQPVKP